MAALIESDFSDRSSERIPKLLNRLLVAFSGHITVFVSNAAIVMKFLFWLKSPRLHRKRIRDKDDNQSVTFYFDSISEKGCVSRPKRDKFKIYSFVGIKSLLDLTLRFKISVDSETDFVQIL